MLPKKKKKSQITTSHHSPCRYTGNTCSAPQATDHEAVHLALSLDDAQFVIVVGFHVEIRGQEELASTSATRSAEEERPSSIFSAEVVLDDVCSFSSLFMKDPMTPEYGGL